jgi:hypothetical protein
MALTDGSWTERSAVSYAAIATALDVIDRLAATMRPAAREDEIRAGLETAIMELTRSIDTIKHQAKTVTVGTSRSDSDLYDNVLVEAIRAAGADVLSLSRPVLEVLRSLAAVVMEATGVTRYAVSWAEPAARFTRVITKSGSAAHLPSRADMDAPLTGSKRRVVELGAPRLLRGQCRRSCRHHRAGAASRDRAHNLAGTCHPREAVAAEVVAVRSNRWATALTRLLLRSPRLRRTSREKPLGDSSGHAAARAAGASCRRSAGQCGAGARNSH